ncbi:hypothetical protein [Kitasatospora phosalacinea]|uniref:FtsX-like permease family protein n=1 Tax=Kitasatospora phosalacinea TaxID=2065 RepID=A0ABW6GLA7_9ACTN
MNTPPPPARHPGPPPGRRPGWRPGAALTEGARSWRYGRWATLLTTALAVAAVALPAVLDSSAVSAAVTGERAWVAAGGRVLVVSNPQAGLSRQVCEGLNGVDGVQAAFAATREDPAPGTAAAPGRRLPVATVTAGAARFLGLAPTGDGAIVSAHATGTTGAGPWLSFDADTAPAAPDPNGRPHTPLPTRPLPIAAVTDLAPLGDAYDYGVLLPVPATGTADDCFVRADAAHWHTLRDNLAGLFGRTDPTRPTLVRPRLADGAFARDYAAEYHHRPTAALPYAAGAGVGLLWLLLRWLTRSRDGLYQTLGAGPRTRMLIALGEWSCTLLVAAPAGAALALGATALLGLPADVAFPFTARACVLSLATATAVAATWFLLPRPDPLALVKDR